MNIKKILKFYFLAAGLLANLFVLWMLFGWPIFVDKLLIKSEKPEAADYIVCICGGLSGNNLPTEDGWGRIYTSVQLYLDGFAPKVIFSGGGAEKITEAEVYAEVANWLGCPNDAVLFEGAANGTADHPANLLKKEEFGIRKDSRLNIVTTPLHSKRTYLVFKKAGFTNVRLVTGYSARKITDPAVVRILKESKFAEFRPSGKNYGDVFNRLKWRSGYFFSSLRELAAITAYKIKGKI